jgi:hypothetical protein
MLKRTILAGLLAFGIAASATAQTPGDSKPKPATPATKPTAPVKPVTTGATPASAPLTGPVTIICRDFRFGAMPGKVPVRDTRVTYEKVIVRDASGANRTIFAPTSFIVSHEFKAAATAIGPDGRGLVTGECGVPNAAITGATGPTLLQFYNFPSVLVESSKLNAVESSLKVVVNLPPCPSGLRSIPTVRQNANDFFASDPAAVTCLP